MSQGHLPSDQQRQPVQVQCKPCGHKWIGFYLPLPIKDACKAMGNLTCPMCAAGSSEIVVFDGSAT